MTATSMTGRRLLRSLAIFNHRLRAAGALALIGVAALTLLNVTNGLVQFSTEPSVRGRIMAPRLAVSVHRPGSGDPAG
jgi:hypothetical protein